MLMKIMKWIKTNRQNIMLMEDFKQCVIGKKLLQIFFVMIVKFTLINLHWIGIFQQ